MTHDTKRGWCICGEFHEKQNAPPPAPPKPAPPKPKPVVVTPADDGLDKTDSTAPFICPVPRFF